MGVDRFQTEKHTLVGEQTSERLTFVFLFRSCLKKQCRDTEEKSFGSIETVHETWMVSNVWEVGLRQNNYR